MRVPSQIGWRLNHRHDEANRWQWCCRVAEIDTLRRHFCPLESLHRVLVMLSLLIAEAEAVVTEIASDDSPPGDMMQKAQLFMVAGFLMLGWVLARRQLKHRKESRISNREANKELHRIRNQKTSSVPLSDAPPETQRWQAAMFDLQRELSADLDNRIVMVQSLIRQLDERIETLSDADVEALEKARRELDGLPPSGDELRQIISEKMKAGSTPSQIALELSLPVSEIEWTAATMA